MLASGAVVLCLPLFVSGLADLVGMKSAFLVVPVLLVLAISLNLLVSKQVALNAEDIAG